MADPASSSSHLDQIRWLPYQKGEIKKKDIKSTEELSVLQSQVSSSALVVIQAINLTKDLDEASSIVERDLAIVKNDLEQKRTRKTKIEKRAKKAAFIGSGILNKKIETLDFKIKLLESQELHYISLQKEINLLASNNQVKESQLSLPKEKPDNVNDQDWKVLQGIPKSAFRTDNEAIKFSRREYKNLQYSYILLQNGQLLRETHKSKHPKFATSAEEPIGKGGFKVVSNLQGDSKLTSYVRSVVQDIDKFDEAIFSNQQARDLFKDSPNIVTGIPHHYKSIKSGKDKLVYYSPKMTPLDEPIKKGTLTRNQQIKVIGDLILGVKTIHNEGRAHRDLKADNLLVKDGTAYVFDFDALTSGRKQDNIIGTPTHQPPRFWKHIMLKPKESQQCDIYAIGVTTLEVFSPVLYQRFTASLRKMLPPAKFGETLLTEEEKKKMDQNIVEGQKEVKALLEEMKKEKEPYLQLAARIIGEEPGFEDIDQLKRQFDLIK